MPLGKRPRSAARSALHECWGDEEQEQSLSCGLRTAVRRASTTVPVHTVRTPEFLGVV